MRRRSALVLILALAGVGGVLAVVTWPAPAPVQVRAVHSQPAEIFDDAGAELRLVTLAISRRARTEGSVYFDVQATRVEANIAGRWVELQGRVSFSALGANETKETVVLVPPGASLCRLRLHYAGASIPWRLGGELGRLGIKLPPRYWGWAGWPKAEGTHPRYKETIIQFPLRPLSLQGRQEVERSA